MTAAPSGDLTSIARDITEADRLAVVDFDHLSAFTEGDEALETELADLYLTTARHYLKAMQGALQEQRAWSGEAHALKGASGNLGACRVAALARMAEFEAPTSMLLEALQLAVEDVASALARGGPRP